MKSKEQVDKEKERVEKMKALRRELEEKLEEQLPEGVFDDKFRVEVQKIDEGAPLEPERAKNVVEALIFAASKPLTAAEIRKVVKTLTVKEIDEIVAQLKAEYEQNGRSFEIVEIAGGYEIATRKVYAPWIFKIEMQKKAKQVTQSALETLAILAYKQPITRAEIEEIRGVDVSGVMNTLVERNLIKIVGKKEVLGRPFLYGTTEKFLEHFGLKSLGELPNIQEIRNIVESSVKKEELLGTQKIVEVSQENQAEPSAVETAGEATPESHSENVELSEVVVEQSENQQESENESERSA